MKSQHRRIYKKPCINIVFFLICSWKNSLPSLQVFGSSNTERHLAGRMCTLQGHIAGNSEYFVFEHQSIVLPVSSAFINPKILIHSTCC